MCPCSPWGHQDLGNPPVHPDPDLQGNLRSKVIQVGLPCPAFPAVQVTLHPQVDLSTLVHLGDHPCLGPQPFPNDHQDPEDPVLQRSRVFHRVPQDQTIRAARRSLVHP
ncbi:hypothetical protein NP493_773g00010 [Ridgeia piscesae]|uniref:Uncharacterized protein n=1 Tax=Ridgeia piscesae TaxID=27915 RepID=A0AAD9KPB8_RIDPI|nr:hypothetical protein NP493_773g00010 [Ridgeia piscesae]